MRDEFWRLRRAFIDVLGRMSRRAASALMNGARSRNLETRDAITARLVRIDVSTWPSDELTELPIEAAAEGIAAAALRERCRAKAAAVRARLADG